MTMENSVTIRYDGTEEQKKLVEAPQGTRIVVTAKGNDLDDVEFVFYKERIVHFKHVFRLHVTWDKSCD